MSGPLETNKPAEPRKVTLREMRDVASDEAGRIRAGQRALIKAGDRAAADAGQIARAEAFEGMVRLFGRIAADKQVRDLLKKAPS